MGLWAALCLSVYSAVAALTVVFGKAGGRKRQSR